MEYSGDLKAFNKLFADYQGRFIRFANMYVRDTAVAEDFKIVFITIEQPKLIRNIRV